MKMDENEWKREDAVEIQEEWNPRRLLKHLRPPQRGLVLRCWSLLNDDRPDSRKITKLRY